MVKFEQLKTEGLKKELALRGARTTGTKLELQCRLRSILEDLGFDLTTLEFEVPVEDTGAAGDALNSVNSIESLQATISAFTTGFSAKMDRFAKEQQEVFSQLASGFQSFEHQMSAEVNQLKQKSSGFEAQLNALQSGVGNEINELKKRIDDLQAASIASGIPTEHVLGAIPHRISPPTFDGSTTFSVFKLQFEVVAKKNLWSETDKAIALTISLKGPAADVLQTVSEADRGSYVALMEALNRRYGSEHLKQMRHLELRSRKQKSGESLQQYASDVERLAQDAFVQYPVEVIEM